MTLDYRNLGRSGLKVAPLCLGAMMFGGATDEATSHRIIAKAKEQGFNFIDTADGYNDGESERVVGRAIKADRDDWILATKVASPRGGLNKGGSSRKWIHRQVEASLQRLGTDYIDIYYLHREDRQTALSETVNALADLVRAGKIRYFGVSNFRAWTVAEISHLADQAGIDRPIASQPCYNAFNRQPEVEHLTACAHYGLAVVPYSPLARGVLTGKYDPDAAPASDTRAGRNDRRIHETEWRPESLRLAQRLKRYAEERGTTAARFALAWVLNSRFVTSAITGPRTEEHWDDYVAALDYRFSEADEAFVDELVTSGHPSTPGYNDPSHPSLGRITRSSR
ncbi:aryl-alcohol dehydrogenase (NADP+) [Arboricoccus pini]|uniref:Aryl-alcohol dehydrogenase (NADP+) n=1 Tax=Arboricoccus pini TaxID=1963835 RepID=A0A212RFD2_9PROT|nr:aldo/keto reductase [Arboricoccus pini]SNB71057.1 aryl-alcohol dehydrogenase (NADP+) [Arboricoccus pini]